MGSMANTAGANCHCTSKPLRCRVVAQYLQNDWQSHNAGGSTRRHGKQGQAHMAQSMPSDWERRAIAAIPVQNSGGHFQECMAAPSPVSQVLTQVCQGHGNCMRGHWQGERATNAHPKQDRARFQAMARAWQFNSKRTATQWPKRHSTGMWTCM